MKTNEIVSQNQNRVTRERIYLNVLRLKDAIEKKFDDESIERVSKEMGLNKDTVREVISQGWAGVKVFYRMNFYLDGALLGCRCTQDESEMILRFMPTKGICEPNPLVKVDRDKLLTEIYAQYDSADDFCKRAHVSTSWIYSDKIKTSTIKKIADELVMDWKSYVIEEGTTNE